MKFFIKFQEISTFFEKVAIFFFGKKSFFQGKNPIFNGFWEFYSLFDPPKPIQIYWGYFKRGSKFFFSA